MLCLKNTVVHYDGVEALKGISIDAEKATFCLDVRAPVRLSVSVATGIQNLTQKGEH